MDFLGFANSDFDFFRKKGTLAKPEYDKKKEEVKTHFREFCYQLQKCYHTETSGTLPLDKDFHGLNKNRDCIKAKSAAGRGGLFGLSIDMSQDGIAISLVCPSDPDVNRVEELKGTIVSKGNELADFFKENREAFVVLYRIDGKKSSDRLWNEEFKFSNRELSSGDFTVLLQNIEKAGEGGDSLKSCPGFRIKEQFPKSDAVKQGKLLPSKACGEVMKLFKLCDALE